MDRLSTVTMLAPMLALFSGAVALAVQDARQPAIDIDHVILGIDDLERGIQQFAALTGVTARRGGEHPGRGTQNALASLGGGRYLEIIAPAGTTPPRDARGMRLDAAELTLAGWALQARSMTDLVARLRAAGLPAMDPAPGSRRTPDGGLLQWQVTAVMQPGLELAPFFIEWSKDTTHPSTSSPPGCTLVSLELTHPDPSRLQSFFAAAPFPATVVKGERQGMALTLDCPRGQVSFRS